MHQEHFSHDNMDLEKISSSIITCHSSNDNESYEGWETMVMVSDEEEDYTAELRKGLWTPEEDSKLTSAIAVHGEGRWSSLAILAGLRRSGKSCRLRWLNYLRPDLRHGTFTLDEQLRILELHFQWGNRWSKIAQHLPGRTDNEVKNYWRTKVQKLARQFQCHVSSPEFRDALRHVWIPRLVEQIQAGANNQTSDNTIGAQTIGTTYDYECGFGLVDSEYITGPRNCCLFGTHTSLDESSMAHNIIGDETLGLDATSFPDFCEAQISQKFSPSSQLDQNLEQTINDNFWEMLLTYGDNLFLMKHIEHFE